MNYYDNPKLSASKLKAYLSHDPAIAYWAETHPTPETEALKLGKALHTVMERKELVVSPYDNYRTKEAQAWRDANPEALKAEEAATVENWKTSILNHLGGRYPGLWAVWSLGEYEKEFFSDTHKAKLDCISGNGICLDWKTTADTNIEKVIMSAWRYHWALQAAHYIYMAKAKEFHFVVVSKTEPHPVWVLTCSPAFIEYGRALTKKAEKIRSDYLAGCRSDVRLDPPPWAKSESDFEAEVDL